MSDAPFPIRDGKVGQIIRRPRCEICGSRDVTCRHSDSKSRPGVTVRYYRCNECMNLRTGKPTTFKVTVI